MGVSYDAAPRPVSKVVRAVNIFEVFLWSKSPSQHNDLRLSKPKEEKRRSQDMDLPSIPKK
jgi:hypothetical protein